MPALAISAIGLATSLGGAQQACAAARAGITRVADGAFGVVDRDAFEVVPVSGHPVGTLTAGFEELGLWVRLGALALADLLQRASLEPADLADTAVILCAPSDYHLLAAAALPPPPLEPTDEEDAPDEVGEAKGGGPDDSPRAEGGADGDEGAVTYRDLVPYYATELAPRVFRALGLAPPRVHEIVFDDETGFVAALSRAAELLATRKAARCIVGGVDSLLEPRWLAACHRLQLLKTAVQPTGFMPGEAGALLLVETPAGARRRGASVLGRVEGLAQAMDAPRLSDPGPRGVVLAEVIRRSLAGASGACGAYLADLNGETARAREWGTALVRLPRGAAPATTIIPAVSFGETRAAFGPLAACMAVQAFSRRHAPSDSILVWLASDRGGRSSFVVSRSTP